MKAARYTLRITQGETLREVITPQVGSTNLIDVTGWTGSLIGRTHREATSNLFSLSVGSGITIDESTGEVEYTIADTVTDGWDFEWGWHVLELTSPSGDVIPWHEGPIRFYRR